MRYLTGSFIITTSIFLAADSGKFYGSGYPGWEWVGFIISGLSYFAFALIAYSRRTVMTGLVLAVFVIVNTASATVGASGQLMDQWERSMAITESAEKIDGLKELALSQSADGQRGNSAKNANAFRELTLQSVDGYRPLAWVKIGLILMIRILLELTILILSGNRGSRTPSGPEPSEAVVEPVPTVAARKRNQPTLKGVPVNEEKLVELIKKIKENPGRKFTFGNGKYEGEKAAVLLAQAETILQSIKGDGKS